MGLGQSKRNREPRYPYFQPYQQPRQPFIPNYMPVSFPQPMYPQPGFIPPTYGQGASLPPRLLHYFPQERPQKRKTRRHTTADKFVGGFVSPRDQPSSPEAPPRRTHSESHRPRETVVAPVVPPRNQNHRAPTPFIPGAAGVEAEEEEVDRSRGVAAERVRSASRQSHRSPIQYEQPPVAVKGDLSALAPITDANKSAFGPSGPKPLIPLRNPLPPPPRDIYEMSPYKSLLNLPQTTALLTSFGPQQTTVNVAPLAPNRTLKRNKSIFRAFSRKDKKQHPEQKPPVIVFVPTSQPQQPLNQPQQPSVQRSATQIRQPEARPQTRQSIRRPFAGAGPRDTPIPTTAESIIGLSPGGGAHHGVSSSVSSDVISLPIPPHPTNPPTIKFDQSQSYVQFMNHSPHRVMWNGLGYPTALHLHEALKFLDHRPDIAEQVRQCSSPYEVYPLTAKYAELQRPDWGDRFLPLMEAVLHAKFRQHPDLHVMLLGTGNADLEYADPVDNYWGSGADGQGANQLGKVLTRVREQLREDSPP